MAKRQTLAERKVELRKWFDESRNVEGGWTLESVRRFKDDLMTARTHADLDLIAEDLQNAITFAGAEN